MKKTRWIQSTCVLALLGTANLSEVHAMSLNRQHTNEPAASTTTSTTVRTTTTTTSTMTTTTTLRRPTGAFDLKSEVLKWKKILPAKDVYTKLVDNHGDGFDSLYGTRNVREVLPGVYYRGGANNAYNKNGTRPNQNPLPEEGLQNLCEVGFSEAIYYYSTNFSTAEPTTTCRIGSQSHELQYLQKTAVTASNQLPVLTQIFNRIKGKLSGPIYGHCWNGWHASGLMASLALQQFCHWSHEEALAYWTKNVDGNSSGYTTIKNAITGFQRISSLEISDSERALICPQK